MTSIPAIPAVPITGIDAPNISTDTSRLASRANLEKAGKQFEAVFTQMMLKSMRQTHLAEELFSSKAIDTFRDMQDQKLAVVMAEAKPLGIGKAMVDFLSKNQAALQAAPVASTDNNDASDRAPR
jgi:flagellar protein FlgJ